MDIYTTNHFIAGGVSVMCIHELALSGFWLTYLVLEEQNQEPLQHMELGWSALIQLETNSVT